MSAPAMLTWLHPELAVLDAPPWDLVPPSRSGVVHVNAGGSELALLPLASGAGAESAAARLAADPHAFRAPGAAAPIPFFTSHDAGETQLADSWRGLLPGARYPDTTRRSLHRLIRWLHPGRYTLFRMLEHYALAGFDLEDEARARRFADEPASAFGASEARGAHPLVVVVEGIDGAGKSTHVEALRAHVARTGLAAGAFKIFRHGVFHDTITDVTRRCDSRRDEQRGGARALHLWRLQRIVKAFDSAKLWRGTLERRLAACDVALFDRYLATHLAAGTGRLHHDPYTLELLAGYPRADRTYLLDLPADVALARIGARGARTVDENAYMLDRYRRRLLAFARRDGYVVLDARAPFDENQAAMRADLDAHLDTLLARRRSRSQGAEEQR